MSKVNVSCSYMTATTKDGIEYSPKAAGGSWPCDEPDDLGAWLGELDRRVKALEAKQVKRCGYCGQVIE